jgi:predicted nuclease of restriction endonuclease-like (RecB) superfamily
MRQWFLFYYKAEEKVQQLVRQIPWGHNVLIMNKMKIIHEAEFYIKATIYKKTFSPRNTRKTLKVLFKQYGVKFSPCLSVFVRG